MRLVRRDRHAPHWANSSRVGRVHEVPRVNELQRLAAVICSGFAEELARRIDALDNPSVDDIRALLEDYRG